VNTAPQVNTIPHRDWPSAAALGLALVSLAGQDGDGGGRVVGAGSGGDAALAGGLDDEAARQPDSPISRFHGPDLASKVRLEAQPRGESGDGKLVPEPVPAKVNLMTCPAPWPGVAGRSERSRRASRDRARPDLRRLGLGAVELADLTGEGGAGERTRRGAIRRIGE